MGWELGVGINRVGKVVVVLDSGFKVFFVVRLV